MPSSNNTAPDLLDELPTPLLGDYIELIYLTFVIVIGVPSNLFILRRLLRDHSKQTQKDSVKAGFLQLKINLNISDLFLLLMALCKVIWLITYNWAFGSQACKIYQFMTVFSLYISSYIVVCIALDRLRNVMAAHKIHGNYKRMNPVKALIACSWIFSFVSAIPQYFVFDVIELSRTQKWYQCSDIWMIARATNVRKFNDVIMSDYTQDFYNISHLVIVFWGPLLILMISYVLIATKLMSYSLQGVQGQDRLREPCLPSDYERGDETASIMTMELKSVDSKKASWMVWRKNTTISLDGASTLSVPHKNSGKSIASSVNPRSGWRRQLRSKVFRTTLLVVAAHFLFWFPYNALGLMKYINEDFYEKLSEHGNIFKDMQILITLINPFLYGFSK